MYNTGMAKNDETGTVCFVMEYERESGLVMISPRNYELLPLDCQRLAEML